MPYSAISHTSEHNKHSEKIFSQFAFNYKSWKQAKTKQNKNKKQNFVKHQDYNKVTFLQFSAYKTNQQTSVYSSQKINKKRINQAKTHQNDLILWR